MPKLLLLVVAGFVSGAALLGCEPPRERTATSSSAIIDGTPDPGHPSVGTISGQKLCSSTLIGPSTVLTAAHCIGEGAILFRFPGGERRARQVAVHPDYRGSAEHDIALLLLEQPVTEVTPSPVSASTLGSEAPLILVGFGQGSVTPGFFDFGTKRVSAASSGTILRYAFDVLGPQNICFGDSGGPSFAADALGERIVGVHSRTNGCRVGYDVRVDAYVPWIVATSGGDAWVAGDGISLGIVHGCNYNFECDGNSVCSSPPGEPRRCESGA